MSQEAILWNAVLPSGAVVSAFVSAAANPVVESRFINAAHRAVTLLVEAGSDKKFWQMHTVCLIRDVGQGGRKKVYEALAYAKNFPDIAMLALVDADFDRLENTLHADPDLIHTDEHDLETTLLTLAGCVEKLILHQAELERLRALEREWMTSFRKRLFDFGMMAGRLRWLNHRMHLGLCFRRMSKTKVSFLDYADASGRDWSPDCGALIQEVLNFSQLTRMKSQCAQLEQECRALPDVPAGQLCNGHDLLGFLGAALSTVLKRSAAPQARDPLALADLLFAIVERPWIKKTQMWQALVAWEQAHPGLFVIQQG